MALASAITVAMAFSAAHAALIIQYDFEGNTAEATTNDLASLGVVAGEIQTSIDLGGDTGIANDRWQRKLLDPNTTNMSFTITIPQGVTLDLTELNFVFGIDSRQGSNDTFAQWDLTISTGSASPDSSGPVLLEGTNANDYREDDYTVTLSGLTGLTDTSVTFDFLVNYGVQPDFSGGGNNNNRHAFFDDVTLTVIPEPSTAGILAIFAGAALLRRRLHT